MESSSAVVGRALTGERVMMDAHAAIMVYGPIILVVWRGETTKHAVETIRRVGLDATRRHGKSVAIGIVEDSAKLPGSEGREHSARVNDELAAAGMVAAAGVLPGQGFIAASVRGIVTGLTLLSRKRYPFRVFQYPKDAVEWCHGMLGGSFRLASAVAAVDEFRAEYAKSWAAGLN